MDTAEGKGLGAMLWFPNSSVMATVKHILEVKQTFPTDLWLLTASFQSYARGRREEDAISKPSSVSWRVISSPLLIPWGSCTFYEIHQKKSHGALIFYISENTIPHDLSMFFSLTLPCHESQGSSSQHTQHCRHARLCQNTAQVPVHGACFHSNYTFHNWLVKHFEDMTPSVANTKCWTGLTWAIK